MATNLPRYTHLVTCVNVAVWGLTGKDLAATSYQSTHPTRAIFFVHSKARTPQEPYWVKHPCKIFLLFGVFPSIAGEEDRSHHGKPINPLYSDQHNRRVSVPLCGRLAQFVTQTRLRGESLSWCCGAAKFPRPRRRTSFSRRRPGLRTISRVRCARLTIAVHGNRIRTNTSAAALNLCGTR